MDKPASIDLQRLFFIYVGHYCKVVESFLCFGYSG